MKRINWSEYNERLVRRGRILINSMLLSELGEIFSRRISNRGRPYKYSGKLIAFLVIIRIVMGLSYRITEGLASGLLEMLGVNEVPDFRTIYYRLKKAGINLEELLKVEMREDSEGFEIIVDSTGFSVGRGGEWIRIRGVNRRRGYVKVHLLVDANSNEIIGAEVSDERGADGTIGARLIRKAIRRGIRIKMVIGDSAYDTYEMFRELERNNIKSCIKLRSNAAKCGIALRDNLIWRRRFVGESEEERANYKKRLGIERLISIIKRLFGDRVSSFKMDMIEKEIMIKLAIVNVFTLLMRGLIN